MKGELPIPKISKLLKSTGKRLQISSGRIGLGSGQIGEVSRRNPAKSSVRKTNFVPLTCAHFPFLHFLLPCDFPINFHL